MRVGITYRVEEKYEPYRDAGLAVGLEPGPILPSAGARLQGLDGLVLAGGTDLNTGMYGQDGHAGSEERE